MLHAVNYGDSRVVACTHGAQVISWSTSGIDHLYTSALSPIATGVAHRGGIPVIFPQFGTWGTAKRHGFARESDWFLVSQLQSELIYRLTSDSVSTDDWPHPFTAQLKIAVGPERLNVELDISNNGDAPFSFTAALHTYLRVDDLALASILGLEGLYYLDAAQRMSRIMEDEPTLTFDQEVDRIYLGAHRPVTLKGGSRSVQVVQSGFQDLVVWNPGSTVASKIMDLEPDGYRRFVCIEAAAISEPVVVTPGARWFGQQTLIV